MEFWLKENRVIIEVLPMKGWCGTRKKSSGARHAVPPPLLTAGADGRVHKHTVPLVLCRVAGEHPPCA